jgi:hypothetical protein
MTNDVGRTAGSARVISGGGRVGYRPEIGGATGSHGRRHSFPEPGRRGTRPLGVRKDVKVGERQLANQRQRRAVIVLRLAGKSRDDVGAERAEGAEPYLHPACGA